jgi:hypothetical protein
VEPDSGASVPSQPAPLADPVPSHRDDGEEEATQWEPTWAVEEPEVFATLENATDDFRAALTAFSDARSKWQVMDVGFSAALAKQLKTLKGEIDSVIEMLHASAVEQREDEEREESGQMSASGTAA